MMPTLRASDVDEVIFDIDDNPTIVEEKTVNTFQDSSDEILDSEIIQYGYFGSDAIRETINSSSNILEDFFNEDDVDDDKQFYIVDDIEHPSNLKDDKAISQSNTQMESEDLCMKVSLRENIENLEPVDNEMYTDQLGSDDESDIIDQGKNVVITSKQFKNRRIRCKRYLELFCKECNVQRACSKMRPGHLICRLCRKRQFFQCRRCKKHFTTFPMVRDHLRKYCLKDRFWHCSQCEYSFCSEPILEIHIKKAHVENNINGPISCEACGKKFSVPGRLISHIKICTDVNDKEMKRFKCEVCSFRTKFRNGLTKHRLTHIPSGERPVCVPDIISNKLNGMKNEPDAKEEQERLHNLIKLHCTRCELTYDNTKLFGRKCEICKKPVKYRCGNCNELSLSYVGIYDHVINSCSFEERNCSKCNRKLKNEYDLIKHEHVCGQVVYLQCEVCSYKTKSKSYFKKHVKMVHDMEIDVLCKWM